MFIPLFKKKLAQEEYIHVLITHFNLDYSKTFPTVPLGQYKNPEWLGKRFDLFEKYCLPSVERQTDKNFLWLCTFHEDTPEPFMSRIKEYAAKYSYMKLYFGTRFDEYIQNFVGIIKENMPQKPYLVTTRLDNDDGIAVDYIENIHKNLYETKNGYFIDYIYGYIYDVAQKQPYFQKFRRNPFSTRVERWENAQTIRKFSHDTIDDHGDVLRVKNKNNPMWLQVIHENNVMNEVDGVIPNDLSDFKSRFIIAGEQNA